jgi:hypothetical protein
VDLESVEILSNASGNDVVVSATKDLTVQRVVAGSINLTARDGSADVTQVGSSGHLELTSRTGAIREGNDDAGADIVASRLKLRAATGITNLETQISAARPWWTAA